MCRTVRLFTFQLAFDSSSRLGTKPAISSRKSNAPTQCATEPHSDSEIDGAHLQLGKRAHAVTDPRCAELNESALSSFSQMYTMPLYGKRRLPERKILRPIGGYRLHRPAPLNPPPVHCICCCRSKLVERRPKRHPKVGQSLNIQQPPQYLKFSNSYCYCVSNSI